MWDPYRNASPKLGRILSLATALILWVVPTVLFVGGFDRKRWDPDYVYQPGAQADFREVGVRTVFWFIGSLSAELILLLLFRHR